MTQTDETVAVTDEEFCEYECIRASGISSMFSPQAREATGLPRDKYLYILRHYTELHDACDPNMLRAAREDGEELGRDCRE